VALRVLRTTSQLLSLHQTIEEENAGYYFTLAEKYPEYNDLFTKHAKDSLRFAETAQRAYREGVTDAFEVGFLATTLNTDDYQLEKPDESLSEDIQTMIINEEIIVQFCLDAASNSSKLLPDVPETFHRLVKRKKRSIERLKEIAYEGII
jgi:hypothetical protein